MSIFGAIEVTDDVEQAVIDTLRKWFKTYLVEYELQAGLITDKYQEPKHPLPKQWLRANDLDKANADALPSIVVVSPGISPRSVPHQEGDGSFRVFFSIGVGVFAGATVRHDTMKLIRVYTAIIRTIMLQKQALGGYADGSTWLDESYDNDFTFEDDQTISAGQVVFEIEVSGIVNRYGGPAVEIPDPEQPGSDWPTVETHEEIIERMT
jgi:hypothetical protein